MRKELSNELIIVEHTSGALEVNRPRSLGVVVISKSEIPEFMRAIYRPVRDDAVAEWLKRQRDWFTRSTDAWMEVNQLLDDYRLHADTGTPLDQEVEVGECRD